MDHYQLIAALHDTFALLEQGLAELRQRLTQTPLLNARVFPLPIVEKGKEHDPITQIAVTALQSEAARDAGLAHFQRLFIHHYAETVSSKAAIRLPGALCFQVTQADYEHTRQLIDTINTLKANLEQLITRESGLPAEQRFEFVHAHLPGLITLSAYRSLTLLIDPDTVRLGWANKHVVNTLTREAVLEKLEKSLQAERGISPTERATWQARVTQELIDIKRLPQDAVLKIKRPVKVQPIARVWYREAQKQVQHPCPSPLLVLCRDPSRVPLIGELGSYLVDSTQPKFTPKAKTLRLLIPRLNLYLDESA
ncbi:MAG: DNA replication terminus site-binding protein [Symbiopectobacterium sp.]|uniref:DNA replication terminus site-binding protein n=1 Tax=Symbiopectobacterium sp. TaxID=2952789 RepID=UPI0039EA5941